MENGKAQFSLHQAFMRAFSHCHRMFHLHLFYDTAQDEFKIAKREIGESIAHLLVDDKKFDSRNDNRFELVPKYMFVRAGMDSPDVIGPHKTLYQALVYHGIREGVPMKGLSKKIEPEQMIERIIQEAHTANSAKGKNKALMLGQSILTNPLMYKQREVTYNQVRDAESAVNTVYKNFQNSGR